jgi:hypothetical protein
LDFLGPARNGAGVRIFAGIFPNGVSAGSFVGDEPKDIPCAVIRRRFFLGEVVIGALKWGSLSRSCPEIGMELAFGILLVRSITPALGEEGELFSTTS